MVAQTPAEAIALLVLSLLLLTVLFVILFGRSSRYPARLRWGMQSTSTQTPSWPICEKL